LTIWYFNYRSIKRGGNTLVYIRNLTIDIDCYSPKFLLRAAIIISIILFSYLPWWQKV